MIKAKKSFKITLAINTQAYDKKKSNDVDIAVGTMTSSLLDHFSI